MYILLSKAKKFLNIDESFTADDELIYDIIQSAEDTIEKRLDIKLKDTVNRTTGYIPKSIESAILLTIGELYSNREINYVNASVSINPTFGFLCDINKNYEQGFV